MARVPLVSTNLAAAGYDAERRTLMVEFIGGRTYAYEDVPPEVFDGLIHAESAGKFFHLNINRLYAYQEVEPPQSQTTLEGESESTVEERLTKLEAEMKRVLQRMTDDGR